MRQSLGDCGRHRGEQPGEGAAVGLHGGVDQGVLQALLSAPDRRRSGPGGAPGAERPWRKLESGMMLTIEPGIYVRPADDVPEAYWNIGIRTEDDALVTDEGCELISRGVSVQAGEIEALMRE